MRTLLLITAALALAGLLAAAETPTLALIVDNKEENLLAIVDLMTLQAAGHVITGKGPDSMAWADRR